MAHETTPTTARQPVPSSDATTDATVRDVKTCECDVAIVQTGKGRHLAMYSVPISAIDGPGLSSLHGLAGT
jgi:hypothetical protein